MFDTRRFLEDHFRDADGVIGLLGAHFGAAPEREAARKWFSRGGVPGSWWPPLLIALTRANQQHPTLEQYCGGSGHDVFG